MILNFFCRWRGQRRRAVASACAGLLVALLIGFTAPLAHANTASGAAAVAESPHALVRSTSNDLVALIQEAKAYAEQDPDRYFSQVQTLLDPIVDFRGFARLVMAAHYKRATPEQRQRFAANFKEALVRTYARALLRFTDEEIRVLDPDGPPANPRRPSVDMEIRTAGGAVYPMSYTMGKTKDGRWQLKNIIINGINMGLTFRNQFASAVRDRQYGGDLDQVIDAWGGLVAETDTVGTES